MKRKIGIIIALTEELTPLLKLLDAKQIEDSAQYKTFTANAFDCDIRIIQCSVGRANAAAATTLLLLSGCSKIFNFGSCGSLYTGKYQVMGEFPIIENGSVVVPEHFIDGDFDLSDHGTATKDPALCGGTPKVLRLVTVSNFPDTLPQTEACLLDMEAYPIVAICTAAKISVKICKVITNSGAEDSIEQFRKERVRACNNAAETAIKELEDFIKAN